MRVLRFLVALLRGVERLFERRQLPAQRADLLVQDLDLRQRARRNRFLGIQRLVELGGAAGGVVAGAGQALVEPLDAVALGFGRREPGA